MPVRRRFLRDAARRPSCDRDDIHQRFVVALRVVTDRNLACVGRNAVIVVAAIREASIDDDRRVAANRQALDMAIAIEEKRAAVMRPVGRFESSRRKIGDAAVGRINATVSSVL